MQKYDDTIKKGQKKPLRKTKKTGKKKKNLLSILTYFLFITALAIGLGYVGGFIFSNLSDLPKIKQLESYAPLESSFIYSSDNELLAELYVERRTFVPYHKIPQHVINAFIAVEDTRFFKHRGIDFYRVAGALIVDIKAGKYVQGASTITQQLAKMLFLKPDRSISRKLKEAALSIQIERLYTKEEILDLYLNQTYFGSRAYGIEAASNTYFGKKTEELTIAEAALLAALPKAPSTYSPIVNPQESLKRRNLALKEMKEATFITEQQYLEALNVKLPTKTVSRKYNVPYFIDYVRSELEKEYGDKLYTAGLKLYTTLDYKMQKIAEEAVAVGLKQLANRGRKNVQASLIAVDIKTGGIKAMVGGTDFGETQFNRATQAMRQPGSAFKPLVFMTAFNKGLTPEDIIKDTPISFPGPTKHKPWTPKNYTREYLGDVTIRTALSKSLNAATVYLCDVVGLKDVIENAKLVGIESKIEPYMPSALGASDITPIELTYAYGAFASGKKLNRTFYTKMVDRDGMVIDEPININKKLLTDKTVSYMHDVLREVILHGTAVKAAKEISRPVYGKTGTTNNYTDAWFIGFDDNIVLGVWVGRDNHKPIGNKETGAKAALPIWIYFMNNI
ncbi:penicillin-binding protein, 1A family [Candidatus Magnetoovum chiemensis]|nr:penicillin-binding protein, 1A family [Candidatus Magnetoovum chiemensis]